MGRKLDLSGLTDTEAEHVLQVVQRDMTLRKKEEERLCELKQELIEEDARCLLLSRQSCFNQRCCIRCCSPFIFLLSPKRQCRDCQYNICKACRVYNKQEKAWLCTTCQKSRLLQMQSLEWFYTNVKRHFKRFGSSKVLKTLYKKQLVVQSALSEHTEGSAYEESIYNEGSICGSDSAFYRQTEEHSMAEMLTVAMRVAEEAIDEAISKAECDTVSQNEAYYLQEHRGELIDELAKTIVQKIISRRKSLTGMKKEYDQNRPLELKLTADLHHHHSLQSTRDHAATFKHQPVLWRSHSAFSLLDADPPSQTQERLLKKDASRSVISTWKSVDQLDNAEGGPSVLKSPDGNWIALQSSQLSHRNVLTKRESPVYSALGRDSRLVSAYQDPGSDEETIPEPNRSWRTFLPEIHRKITKDNFNSQDAPASLIGRRGSRDSDRNWKPNKSLLGLFKRKVPAEIRRPSSSRRTSIIDVNFNAEGTEEDDQKERNTSDAVTPDTLTSGAMTPDSVEQESRFKEDNQICQELTVKLQYLVEQVFAPSNRGEENDGVRKPGSNGQTEAEDDRDEENRRVWRMGIDWNGGRTEEEDEGSESDEEMTDRLYKLVAQSRLTYVTSTDDVLYKFSQSEEEWEGDKAEHVNMNKEQREEKTDRLTRQICQLEREVGAKHFSSTEDELDGIGLLDEEKSMEDEKDGKSVEMVVKVWKLANQINATQFSSTEDELDRAGEEGEEVIDDETMWKLQAEESVQAAQLRDLSCLIVAPQFDPPEHQTYGVSEGRVTGVVRDEASGQNQHWRESLRDLDVKMFDFKDDIEEIQRRTSHEDVTTDNVVGIQSKDLQEDHMKVEKKTREEDEKMIKEQECKERFLIDAGNGKEIKERHELTEDQTEKIIILHKTKVQLENQRQERWSDRSKGEERQDEERVTECKNSQEKWEKAVDSDEENAEFDRIINSMLMMTLEDMGGEVLKDDAAKNGINKSGTEDVEMDENIKIQMENSAERRSLEKKGSSKDSNIWGNNAMAESAVDGRESEELEKDTHPPTEINLEEDKSLIMISKTLEATQTSICMEVEDEQEDRRGKIMTNEVTQIGRTTAGGCENAEKDGTLGATSDDIEPSITPRLEGLPSPEKYSAASLRSITTEVLKVLNATEDLLQEADGRDEPRSSTISLPPNTNPKTMDQQFSRLEENVYVAAGAVYSLEVELGELEECARNICNTTSDMELSFLEEQIASTAAKVQQSELQIGDISARIAALRSAGLDVDTQSRRPNPFMQAATLDSSRLLRRRLPAPPVKSNKHTLYSTIILKSLKATATC
ncbi:rab effector MyRIP-like isoform X4 [Antennarius striatus]|uniref:rab effector MyRIP-like isoform X4 n=2 Tax=Antennarius striatus TaxID=241820 RepID=UPI0035AF818B